jgi:hypothetical protein
MDAIKPKPSAIDRILGKTAPRLEPEDADVRAAFDEVRAPKSRGREGIMLDVRKADGQCYGMSYAYLTRIDFEPGDRMKLHFAGDVVQMEGRRLRSLYRRLLEHRVDAIQEGTDAEDDLKPEDAAHIDRLELISKQEADHDD